MQKAIDNLDVNRVSELIDQVNVTQKSFDTFLLRTAFEMTPSQTAKAIQIGTMVLANFARPLTLEKIDQIVANIDPAFQWFLNRDVLNKVVANVKERLAVAQVTRGLRVKGPAREGESSLQDVYPTRQGLPQEIEKEIMKKYIGKARKTRRRTKKVL
jgi:hypothetical protein